MTGDMPPVEIIAGLELVGEVPGAFRRVKRVITKHTLKQAQRFT